MTDSMHPICDLEVTVNGEQTFFVDKETLLSFSGRLIKLFNKAISANGGRLHSYKVILHELPGGSEAFEEVARFCYRGAVIQINANNVCALRCAGEFLEMTEEIYAGNLVVQTEHFLRGMPFWSWREVLATLKECEALSPLADATGIMQRCIDALMLRINASLDHMSPASSSPESIGFRYSSDTRSSQSSRHSTKPSWWFEDLSPFSIYLVERVVKAMISHGMDNLLVGRFLHHYLRSSSPVFGYGSISPKKNSGRNEEVVNQCPSHKEQREVLETVVSLLHCLQRRSLSCRSLFGILRAASLLNASTFCRKQIVFMIGSQLDQASLDNILIPAPPTMGYHYDVDLVLRFVHIFLKNQLLSLPNSPSCSGNRHMAPSFTPSSICSQNGLKRVGCLMDKYITEVAPDVNLKPFKFQALAEALPDAARDSCDGLYRALDMYLEAHPGLCEEEAIGLCKSINYQKLSFEASKQIAQNPRFPSRIAIQVLLLQQAKLKSALDSHYLKNISTGSANNTSSVEGDDDSGSNEVILYSKQLDYSSVICEENHELKADLQGMQWRVMELEQVCKKMHSQISKLMKLNPKNRNARLPKLCS